MYVMNWVSFQSSWILALQPNFPGPNFPGPNCHTTFSRSPICRTKFSRGPICRTQFSRGPLVRKCSSPVFKQKINIDYQCFPITGLERDRGCILMRRQSWQVEKFVTKARQHLLHLDRSQSLLSYEWTERIWQFQVEKWEPQASLIILFVQHTFPFGWWKSGRKIVTRIFIPLLCLLLSLMASLIFSQPLYCFPDFHYNASGEAEYFGLARWEPLASFRTWYLFLFFTLTKFLDSKLYTTFCDKIAYVG